ncbi:hypothetical protein Dimus_025759 [Dionaea muscipula]
MKEREPSGRRHKQRLKPALPAAQETQIWGNEQERRGGRGRAAEAGKTKRWAGAGGLVLSFSLEGGGLTGSQEFQPVPVLVAFSLSIPWDHYPLAVLVPQWQLLILKSRSN